MSSNLKLEQQPYEIVWAYKYHILLSMYIYFLMRKESSRVFIKKQCKEITFRITEKVFKEEDHPAVILARDGLGHSSLS